MPGILLGNHTSAKAADVTPSIMIHPTNNRHPRPASFPDHRHHHIDSQRTEKVGSKITQFSITLRKIFVKLSNHPPHSPVLVREKSSSARLDPPHPQDYLASTTDPNQRRSNAARVISDHRHRAHQRSWSDLDPMRTCLSNRFTFKQHVQRRNSSVSDHFPARERNVKFAPLPQIHDRKKRPNSISLGVSSRSLLIERARTSAESQPRPVHNYYVPRRYSLPPRDISKRSTGKDPQKRRTTTIVTTTTTTKIISCSKPVSKPIQTHHKKIGREERDIQEVDSADEEKLVDRALTRSVDDDHDRRNLNNSSESTSEGYEDCLESFGNDSQDSHYFST